MADDVLFSNDENGNLTARPVQKPHTKNQVKFFNDRGFVPKGGIRTSSPVGKMTNAIATGKVRPTQ